MSTQKPTIVLDFDRVLFDTNAFIAGLKDAVKPLGVTKDMWEAAYYDRGEDGVLHLPRFAEKLAAKTKASPEAISQALDTEMADAVWYLFGDTRQFLEQFSRQVTLYLLSFGQPEMQKKKLTGAGIEPYFDGIYLVDEAKAESNRLPISAVSRAIFINDNIEEMLELAKLYRWADHIHINRYGTDRLGQQLPAQLPFRSFSSLREASGHIEQLLASSPSGSPPVKNVHQ